MTTSLKNALYTALAQEVLAETKVIIANMDRYVLLAKDEETDPKSAAAPSRKKVGTPFDPSYPGGSPEYKANPPGGSRDPRKMRKYSDRFSEKESSPDLENFAKQTNYIQNTINQFTDLAKQLASKAFSVKKEMYDVVKYFETKIERGINYGEEAVILQDIKNISDLSAKLEKAMKSIWNVLMEIENAEDMSLRLRGKSGEVEQEYMQKELPSLKTLDEALELSAKDTKVKEQLKPFFKEISEEFGLQPSELKKKKLSPSEEKELQSLEKKYLKKSQFFSAPSWFSKIREKFGKQKQEAPAASLMLARTLVRAAVILSE